MSNTKPPCVVHGTNPGIGHILCALRLKKERDKALSEIIEKDAIIARQKQEIAALLEGLVFPGWSCKSCGVFNGEMKEKRSECRCCGVLKTE